MSFDLRELSLFGGEPIVLIEFRRGQLAWRYATGDRPREFGGEPGEPHVYLAPGGIKRGEIGDSSQRAKNRLTITVPITLDVLDNWLPFPTSEPVMVTCFAIHAGESDYRVDWSGRAVGPKLFDTTADIICEPTRSVSRHRGAKPRWCRGCTVPFGSQGDGMCNVDMEAIRTTAVITEVAGLAWTAEEFAELGVSRLAGGKVSWTRVDGEIERRTIMAHTGDTIIVDYGTNALPLGTEVDVWPGCRHTWEDCGEYDNRDNYQGARFIPVKSPYDGNVIA